MATLIVGDIQGCLDSLKALLAEARFGPSDELWCVGDLVNRGPKSLDTLRFLADLGERFTCVLGNHDLHLLAMALGGHPHRPSDTMAEVLAAPDCKELAHWLRHRPLLAEGDGFAMVHAGIPHIWDLATARANAREVEGALRGPGHRAFFKDMYGDEPALWDAKLVGMARHRAVVNYLTRMRLVDAAGRMEFSHKGPLCELPAGYQPWFAYASSFGSRGAALYFGHWAAIDGATGSDGLVGLDTGCVWGRMLSAVRVEDARLFQVAARERRGMAA